MKNKALCMPCLRYGMLLPQGRHQDKSIALIATYYKGWNKSACIQAFLCKWFVPSKTHDLTFVMDYEILEKE